MQRSIASIVGSLRPRRRRGRIVAGTIAAVGLALTPLVLLPDAASAAVPTFPDNILVFPDRDFVSIQGYADHAGETALVEVTRPDAGVIGSAKGVVSGTDVAFEVNHPGGLCWGAGTGLDVTPDIKAGDVVSITFPDGSKDSTTTLSATVVKDMVENGTTVTVEGTFGPDVNPDFIEQRIIQPDLVDVIGKRSISAVPGPLVPAPKGGYSSSLEFPSPGHFLATYVFDTQQAADVTAAATLGERAMSWEVQDVDGNRQGLTIAEFGEAGGPGVGGCPAGPGQQGSPTGSASVVRSADRTSALVKWTPVTAVPTADPVTGYSIEAVGAAAGGQQSTQGLRVAADATQVTLNGLDPAATYTVEVRSMAGDKMSVPFALGGAAGDTTLPTLSLSPAPAATGSPAVETNSVTVTSNGQVFYTTDGSPAIVGDLPADNAKLLTGTSIPINAPTTLKVAAFDQVGNFVLAEGDYTPVVVALPAKPTGLAGTQTQNSVALTWDGVASVDGWQVTVYNAAGTKLATQPPVTTVPRQTVSGLNPGTTYGFTVQARNVAGFGPESDVLTKTTDAATDHITISTAKWRSGDFRVTGTGDKLGAVIQLYRVNADGSMGAAMTGATAQVVAAAPPGIGDWDLRLRNGAAPATSPGRIYAKSSSGGVAGPFNVS